MGKVVSGAEIGCRIRVFRQQAGLTQERLAEKLQVSFQQLQKWEAGRTKVNLVRLQEVAQALRVPISAFFEESEHTAIVLTEEEVGLVKAFREIKVPRHKESVVDIVHGLSKRRG